MKKLFSIIAFATLFLSVTGCSTLSSFNAFDSGTAISSANFHYVKSVEGSASSTYLFGLFGGDNASRAMADARERAALKDNQALANVSVTRSSKVVLGVVTVVTTNVTADVIEFE